MEKIRAFIAVELPSFLKKELGRIESILKAGNTTPVKWVDFESIHLTLKFLGDIESSRVGEIIEGIKNACVGISPFELKIKGLGVFPNPARTRIAWVGLVDATDELSLLQRNIESEMEKLEYERETRKFSPHLTLARVRDQATPDERERFGNLVTATTFSSERITVNSVSLMKSHLTRQGALYTRLGSIRLG
jgi:2'-5' RNA ligase